MNKFVTVWRASSLLCTVMAEFTKDSSAGGGGVRFTETPAAEPAEAKPKPVGDGGGVRFGEPAPAKAAGGVRFGEASVASEATPAPASGGGGGGGGVRFGDPDSDPDSPRTPPTQAEIAGNHAALAASIAALAVAGGGGGCDARGDGGGEGKGRDGSDDDDSGSEGGGSGAEDETLKQLIERLDLDVDGLDSDDSDNLDDVEELDLSEKGLKTVPKAVLSLSGLTGLFMEDNKLTSLPDALAEELGDLEVRRAGRRRGGEAEVGGGW